MTMQLIYRDTHSLTSPDGTTSEEQCVITYRDMGGYESVEKLQQVGHNRWNTRGSRVENIENGIRVTYDKPRRVVVEGWITETTGHTLTIA